MEHTISVLGSTGSVGRQTLEVAEACGVNVMCLAANRSAAALEEQARRFSPALAVLRDEAAARELKVRLADTKVRVAGGEEGMLEAAALDGVDTVVTGLVGVAGLLPTLAAVDAGKRIALANKETLVCAGELVMERARKSGAEILPVDSEHSAVFQCLEGNRDRGEVKRIILTASGGPFFGYSKEQLSNVTPGMALKHPNWSMGAKITVDSATLMNKGLECLEAMALFDMPLEKISVVIHRESIVHSLVEYCDNALLAQLGAPDMRLPIQYALFWPERREGPAAALDLLQCPPLTFSAPDGEAFPSLALARRAAETGGVAPAVLNGANEAAVALFLRGEIGFCDIPRLVERALGAVGGKKAPSVEEILQADADARRLVRG